MQAVRRSHRHCQSMEAFGRISSSTLPACVALFALGKLVHYRLYALNIFQSCSLCDWVLPVEYSVLDFSGDSPVLLVGAILGSTVDTWSASSTGRLDEFHTFFHVAVRLESRGVWLSILR